MDFMPVPSSDFCRKLKMLDPDLHLNFDTSVGVWQIWLKDRNKGNIEFIMNVVENDGSYRQLDDRTIAILRANKFFAENPKDLEEHLCDGLEKQIKKEAEKVHDDCKHFSKDKFFTRKYAGIIDNAKSISVERWNRFLQNYKPKNGFVTTSKGGRNEIV